MQKGKYAGHNFTPDQLRARAWWRKSHDMESKLLEALIAPARIYEREELHAKLDKVLDSIAARRARAVDLFSDVGGSFTIASFTINF